MREIICSKNEENVTLIKVLNKYLPLANNSFLYKMLRKKNITLNDKKAEGNEKLKFNDSIKIYFSDETFDKFSGANDTEYINEYNSLSNLNTSRFKVIYEDDDILAIDKPINMLSQKAKDTDISANELFLSYLIKTNKLTLDTFKTFHPSVANRLDRNTTGVLLFGKTMKGLHYLSSVLKDHSIDKFYVALCKGCINEKIKVDTYLIKDEKTNKVQITDNPKNAEHILMDYEPIKFSSDYTLLRIKLLTGKSHQIRAHLSAIGHPILGDIKYGDKKINDILRNKFNLNSQLLHANIIDFKNGNKIVAPIPQIFDTIIGWEGKNK